MQVGKYQLIRELAVGGMAEVFLARTAGPGGFEKQLVLKRILPHLARDPAFIQMFLSEATLAARLTHPNIVQIFDFGEADGTYYLAMEYIDGPSLRTLLDDSLRLGGPLPPVVCARMIAAACEGLAFAHDFTEPATGQRLDIVHRDISPDNVLLSRQGAVKVADFGIAKASGGQQHRTRTGMIKGKLAYMPPEQIRNETLDRRVDVYSLGVVFYELLTGRRPFDAPTDASLMHEILFEEAVPAARLQPGLPESVLRILDRVLAKDREQRYPDCVALQADLEQYILSTGRPVTTQHVAQLIAQVSPRVQAVPTPVPLPTNIPMTDTLIRTREPAPPPPSQEFPNPAPWTERRELEAAPLLPVEVPTEVIPPPAEVIPPPTEVIPPPAETLPAVKARAAPSWKRGVVWAALGGAVLLGAGGGYLSRETREPEDSLQPTLEPHAGPSEPQALAAKEPPPPPAPVPVVPPPPAPVPVTPAPPPPVAPVPGAQTGDAASPHAQEDGFIIFEVKPSATIYLLAEKATEKVGTSPNMLPVQIPPGTYTFAFVNKQLGKSVKRQIEVKAGHTVVVQADLLTEENSAP